MTTTEEWLRRGLGEGDDGPLPERLQPSRLRRQARRSRRRRNTVGVAAVVIVAGLGVSQGERVGALRRPSPADTPPVVLVSPTVSPTAPTVSPTAPTVSPTAPTETIAVTDVRLDDAGEGNRTVTFAYRAPRDVVVSGEGPDGANGGTEDSSGGPGEFVAEFRPGTWTVKAVRLRQGRSVTVATTEVEVPALAAWPRVDDMSLSSRGRCGSGGPDVVLRFTAGAATSGEVTFVVKHEKGAAGQVRRVLPLQAEEVMTPVTNVHLPWPCDEGYANSRNYYVHVVTRDAGGRSMEGHLGDWP